MKNYRYDVICADVDYHIKDHPVTQMCKLGFNIVKGEPVPIGDCWWFRVNNDINIIPEYLTILPDDFKFSDGR